MHLAICTQYYPPEIGAPQNRLSELAKRFVEAGHRVTVLTAMPNYPTGKIHDGYGGLTYRERIDGVEVIRTFIYPTQSASFIKRLANYFSFVVSSAVIGTFLLPRPDYLMVESPPLFLAISGVWLQWIKRAKLIFNVSDLWPESAVTLGLLRRGGAAYRISEWLERMAYKRAWLVTGQSKGIIGDIRVRFPSVKTFHLSNGADTARFGLDKATSADRELLRGNGQFVALYCGLHGLAQGLEQIVEVASYLPEIRFAFVGDGPQKAELVRRARQLDLENIVFLDPRPSRNIPSIVAAADVLLVPLKVGIPGAVPSKLYEAMASEKPVVLIAEGEASEIVSSANAGLTYSPGDVAGIVEGLKQLCGDREICREMGSNGRKAACQYYDRNGIATRFIQHLESRLGGAEQAGEE